MKTSKRTTLLRSTLPILAAILLTTFTVACTPEQEAETNQELAETEAELEAAGDRAGAQMEEAGERANEQMKKAGAAMERGIERANERLEPYAEDAGVTAKVKTRLTADPDVNPFPIDVDTIDGVVTLSGVVSSQAQKDEAEKLARNTEGVVRVVNNLEVGQRGS